MNNGKSYVYRNPRPELAVERGSGRSLGNCYRAHLYLVTSLRPLDMEAVRNLRQAGVIGYGQTYSASFVTDDLRRLPVPEKLEWKLAQEVGPTGFEMVPCIEVDDTSGEPTGGPANNPYTGQPYAPSRQPYYVYEIEDRIDSSG